MARKKYCQVQISEVASYDKCRLFMEAKDTFQVIMWQIDHLWTSAQSEVEIKLGAV